MNKSRDILDYLTQPGSARTVILAPNAPPIARTYSGVAIVLSKVFDAADIADTLEHLHTEASPMDRAKITDSAGTFSFSQKGVGRIRVTYATQRGSYVVSVTTIPYDIPKPEAISDKPEQIVGLIDAILADQNIFVAVSGPDPSCSSTLIYSILQEINLKGSHIIAIIEARLNYLLGHSNSVVMQFELGNDTPSIAQGLAVANDFKANFFFVNNIEDNEDLPSLRHVLAGGSTLILNSVSLTPQMLSDRYAEPIKALMPQGKALQQFHIRVFPTGDSEKLDIHIDACSP